MTLYILSNRELVSSVSLDPVYELEDLIAEVCDAELLVPTIRESLRWVHKSRKHTAPFLKKVIHKTIGSYSVLEPTLPVSAEPNILLVIGIAGNQLQLLSSIPDWRQRFDRVIAYIFDAWELSAYPSYTNQIDHLFVPIQEAIPILQRRFEIPVSLLPFGVDAVNHGGWESDRPIDVISYGRLPNQFHQEFFNALNQPGSNQIYYRSIPRKTEIFPEKPYMEREDYRDRQFLFHILQRSKVALAFDTLYPGMRSFPYSFVTLRWFECGATGCALAGKRPTTPLGDELLNWKDATIELPDDPVASVQLVQELLADKHRLQAIHQRNYLKNLRHHDWRSRIRDMFEQLHLPIPERLVQETDQLNMLYQRRRQILETYV